MATRFVRKGATGANNGTSWENAYSELNQINWNAIGSGDVIEISGGGGKLVYTTALSIQKSNITIRRSSQSGHNGIVVIFGGRINHLPHSFDPSWSQQGRGQDRSGIHLNSSDNVTIEGGILGGITIHGWNTHGIQMNADASGTIIRHLDIYSCGEIKGGSNGKWRSDHHGINVGSNTRVENCWIHICGQDGIQSRSGVNFEHNVFRNNWISNEIAHKTKPRLSWNYREHCDGIQSWRPSTRGLIIEDNLIGPGWWHSIILNDFNADTRNAVIRRNTIFGSNTVRFNGKGSTFNSVIEDNIIHMWRTQFDDDGRMSGSGETYYMRGSGNVHRRNLWSNGGAVSMSNGIGAQSWSDNFKSGPFAGSSIPATTVSGSGLFANPGQDGGSGHHNIAHDWDKIDLTILNESAKSVGAKHSGPIAWLRDVTGIRYKSVPRSVHATSNSNYARFLEFGNRTASSGVFFSYQPTYINPDRGSMSFSATGLPPGVTVDSNTGRISGTPNQAGNFTITQTITVNGNKTSAEMTLVVEGSSVTTRIPVLVNPGDQACMIGDGINLPIEVSNPSGSPLTYFTNGLPPGLVTKTDGQFSQQLDLSVGTISIESDAVVVWDYDLDDGSLLSVRQSIDGVGSNPGNPKHAEGDMVGGVPRIIFGGGGSGMRTNKITISFSRPISGDFAWSAFDIDLASDPRASEGIQNISHGGAVSNLGGDSRGLIRWSGLTNASSVSYEWTAPSEDSHSGHGPTETVLLSFVNTSVRIQGSPILGGDYDVTIGALDELGNAPQAQFGWKVAAVDQPEPGLIAGRILSPYELIINKISAFQIQFDDQIESLSVSPLPAGMNVDTNTGLISGMPTTVGETTTSIKITGRSAGEISVEVTFKVIEPTNGAIRLTKIV